MLNLKIKLKILKLFPIEISTSLLTIFNKNEESSSFWHNQQSFFKHSFCCIGQFNKSAMDFFTENVLRGNFFVTGLKSIILLNQAKKWKVFAINFIPASNDFLTVCHNSSLKKHITNLILLAFIKLLQEI